MRSGPSSDQCQVFDISPTSSGYGLLIESLGKDAEYDPEIHSKTHGSARLCLLTRHGK
jgi:hypothetical protein